ncbi:hypothetical protein Tco_0490863 [Tanacetum coccineum]
MLHSPLVIKACKYLPWPQPIDNMNKLLLALVHQHWSSAMELRTVTDFDINLFKLASFPFSFCTSLRHPRDGRLRTASALSGHTFSPSAFTL